MLHLQVSYVTGQAAGMADLTSAPARSAQLSHCSSSYAHAIKGVRNGALIMRWAIRLSHAGQTPVPCRWLTAQIQACSGSQGLTGPSRNSKAATRQGPTFHWRYQAVIWS